MHVVSHAITCDKKRFSTSDGLRVFANISPLISTTGINHGLDHVKCVEVLVRRSSPVRKLASTHDSTSGYRQDVIHDTEMICE